MGANNVISMASSMSSSINSIMHGKTISIAMTLLGRHTFLVYSTWGRLEGVDLELSARAKKVVPYSGSWITFWGTIIPKDYLQNFGQTSKSLAQISDKGHLLGLCVGGGADWGTFDVSLSWIDLTNGTIFALLLHPCCLRRGLTICTSTTRWA